MFESLFRSGQLLALIFPHRSEYRVWIICFVVLEILGAGQSYGQGAHNAQSTDKSAATLYQRFCQRCHGSDGGGERNAGVMGLPDFRRPTWQERRSDAQLMASILDGKGNGMPAFRGRLSQDQVRSLISLVRALDPKPAQASSSPTEFQVQFQALEKELQELRRQLDELSAQPSGTERTMPPAERTEGLRLNSGAILYRQHCQRCHGADGKGNAVGLEEDSPPDFTNRAWQQERSDARLLKSIVHGKGAMPAFRKQLSDDEAADLIEYLRGFAPRLHAPLSPPA